MGKIISFLNPKGGTGKSTCIQNIGFCFHLHWQKILLVDADPKQGDLSLWLGMYQGENAPKGVLLDHLNFKNDFIKLREKFDYTFVDGASKTDEMQTQLVLNSDVVIIPVKLSKIEVRDAAPVVQTIRKAEKINKIKAFFLIDADEPRTVISKKMETLLEKYELPILKNRISKSMQYVNSLGDGFSIFDQKGKRNSKLIKEIIAISKELKEKIDE